MATLSHGTIFWPRFNYYNLYLRRTARSTRPYDCNRLSERLVDRRTLRAEQPRPRVRHVKTILQPDAEFPVNRDRWLVAEAHARRQRRSISAYQVSPLVA